MQTITEAPRGTAREPNVRSYMTWSVARLRMAERMADQGNLRYAAEFCEALFGDDRAPAVLQTRVLSLLGLPPSFEPSQAGDGRKRGKAARALEAEEDWWTIAPTTALALAMRWGLVLGVGVNSLPWIAKRKREMPVLTTWHPSGVSYDQEAEAWFAETTKGVEKIAGKDGHGIGARWALFLPYGAHRPWSHGMWRGMARWYLLKRYAIDDWGIHSEKAALRVARRELKESVFSGEGSTKEARNQLANELYEAAKEGVVVLPDGFDLKLVEASANTRDIYEAQINAANLAFGIQVLGHNLTSEVSGQGSFAAGKIGDSVRLDYKRGDNEAVSTFAHDELLVHWASVNFGDADVALWPTYPVEPPRDKKAEADTFTQIAKGVSTLLAAGAPIDARAELEKHEIATISKEEEAKLKAEKAAQPKPPAPPVDDDKEDDA